MKSLAPRIEPGDADGLEERQPGLGLELAPELERPQRAPRVPLLLAVCEPQEARVAARAGADVARRVLLVDLHLEAAPAKLARDRGAEDAGADDGGAPHRAPGPSGERSGGERRGRLSATVRA